MGGGGGSNVRVFDGRREVGGNVKSSAGLTYLCIYSICVKLYSDS